MPAVMVSKIDFDFGIGYYISIRELCEKFPHIDKDKIVELYLVELRNEHGNLIRRFKPFMVLQLETGDHYTELYGNVKHLCLPEDIVTRFNIGKNYEITIIITKYDGKPFLPLEIKLIDHAQRALEYLQRIEANLLSLTLEHPVLNKANSYLWDAWFRLEESDVEGARTAIRNSLEILEKDFVSKLVVAEESEESSQFPKKLGKLVTNIRDFLHYGGPHPGPAPRTTTEMVISLTIELLRYLAISLRQELVIFLETKQDYEAEKGEG